MLDKERIRLMTKMALYEKTTGKEDLKIGSYYKKDYTGVNTLIAALWITLGYAGMAALFVLCNLEFLMERLTIAKILMMGAIAVGVYLILLIIYCVCASSFYGTRHTKATLRMKRYYRDLMRLEKLRKKEKK